MIFCEECFIKDSELRPIIRSLAQKGNCSICGSTDVYIYDTDKNMELVDYFDEFLSIYKPEKLFNSGFLCSSKCMLKEELLVNWNIFNNINAESVYKIITSICNEKYNKIPELFDSPVGLVAPSEEYYYEYSLLKTNSWDKFVSALKTENRFHTNYLNLKILEYFCSFIRKPYKKGDVFYRGRISSSAGFSNKEMGAPPSDKASAGRANSLGISRLYLANDIDTTIREVRADAVDYITVGKFELLEDIYVVDLKLIDKISPFIETLDFMEHAINKEHLRKINIEMGKVLRRSDSPLDYVPTQYISDFIKSIEDKGIPIYSGIEYNSTMNPNGYNLAIFYPELFKCTEVEIYKIKEMNYSTEPPIK